MEFLISPVVLLVVVIGGIVLFKLATAQKLSDQPWPYAVKKYFFTRSEQEFLRLLNQAIDRQRYTIFPKVRLADFVDVTVGGKEYQGWWNRIRSKHIDFLVWDVQNSRIALAIELDGGSHQSEKAQERDEFKNKLYERIGVPLERVRVRTDFATEISRINTLL